MITIGAEAAQWAGLQIDLHTKYRSGQITPDQLEWWLNKPTKERDKFILAGLASRQKTRSRSILRPIQSGLVIPATFGTRTFAQATDIFPGGIYGKNCNIIGEARPETPIVVHELNENGTLQQIFGGQGVSFDQLCLEPEQIIQFVIKYSEHLHPQGYATFFLLPGSSLVASVYWDDDRGLGVYVYHFSCDFVWRAGSRHRVVLPCPPAGAAQLELKSS